VAGTTGFARQTKSLLSKRADGTYELDARGYTCPYPQLFAGAAFDILEVRARLEILTDNPSSCENVPVSIRNRGQKFLGVEPLAPGLWKIIAEKVR